MYFVFKTRIYGVAMLIRQLIFVIISLVSSKAFASYITQSDIQSIDVTAPAGWQTLNTHQLFDGISDRFTTTRFAAYQEQGDKLSASNPYKISVDLASSVNVTSLGLFNDWNNYLDQQVTSMSIELYDEFAGLLWSNDFSNVMQNTWSEIKLVDFSSAINNVKSVDFYVTGAESNHFEIRELLIAYSDASNAPPSSVVISAPSILAIILLGIASIMVFRQK